MNADTSPSQPPIVVVMGVAGSGKSVVGRMLADRLALPFFDADTLHPSANVRKMQAGTPLTDADRAPWLDAVARHMEAAVAVGGGLVVSCSALKRAYRDRLRQAVPGLRLVALTAATEVIRGRLAARTGHFMPAALLDSQLAALEPPTADEGPIVVDVSPPPAAIATAIVRVLANRVRPVR